MKFQETAPDVGDTRFCPECDDYLPKSEFYADKRTKSGLTRRCRTHYSRKSYESRKKSDRPHARAEYIRNVQLRTIYGISQAEYDEMAAAQDHRCAVCRKPETAKSNRTESVRKLSVDHCHRTGRVRALLCSECNTGLGKFRDDPELLRQAAVYLEAHRAGV